MQVLMMGKAFSNNCAYVPLRRRMGIDRLYRAMRESNLFIKCAPRGGKKSAEPWQHLSAYTFKVIHKGQPNCTWEVGITDVKNNKCSSSSGAWLYVQRIGNHDGKVLPVLRQIVALLPEADFDADCGLSYKGPDGKIVPWGGSGVSFQEE